MATMLLFSLTVCLLDRLRGSKHPPSGTLHQGQQMQPAGRCVGKGTEVGTEQWVCTLAATSSENRACLLQHCLPSA